MMRKGLRRMPSVPLSFGSLLVGVSLRFLALAVLCFFIYLTAFQARADEPRSSIGFTLTKWQPITIDQIKQPVAEWHFADGNHGAVTTEYRNIRPSSGCPIFEASTLVGYRFNCEAKNESVH